MTKEEAFKDWGTLNGHTKDVEEDYLKARHVHEIDVELNPGAHTLTVSMPYSCYQKYKCACGFSYSVDSGD